MLTLILAWINAKYKHDYELVFIATFLMGAVIIVAVLNGF